MECAFYRLMFVFFFKQKTAYGMRISDWSSDVCSSDLHGRKAAYHKHAGRHHRRSMDESGYRRRSLHCVRKPSVKTNLRRLAHGTDEQQQAEDRHRIPAHAQKADG